MSKVDVVKFENDYYGVRHTYKFLWFFTVVKFLHNDSYEWYTKSEIRDPDELQFNSESMARLQLRCYYENLDNKSDTGSVVDIP